MMPPLHQRHIIYRVIYGHWLLDRGRVKDAADVAADLIDERANRLSAEERVFIGRCRAAAGHPDEARLVMTPVGQDTTVRSMAFHESAASLFTTLGQAELVQTHRQLSAQAEAAIQSVREHYPSEHRRLGAEIATRVGRAEPLLVQFGCWNNPLPGFINLDHVPAPEIAAEGRLYQRDDYFLVGLGPLPFAADSVDFIFNEDFIEHLAQKEQIKFLAEASRMLKPGAIHRISTPDLLGNVANFSQFGTGWDGVWNYEWDAWEHLALFTPAHLREVARMIGYREVIFTKKNESTSPYRCPERRPFNDREEGANIYADLIK